MGILLCRLFCWNFNWLFNMGGAMINPNPTCDKDCRFTAGVGSRTCAYYQPIYDKHGNNTNPDLNTTTYSMGCLVCGMEWIVSEQNGKTTIRGKVCTS